ncbi:unnamed protein product, partial [Meganyctiphanes norvegica]
MTLQALWACIAMLFMCCTAFIFTSYDKIITVDSPISDLSSYAYDTDLQDDTLDDTAPSSECEKLKNVTLEEFFTAVETSSENVFLIWPLDPILIFRALCAVESWAFNHPTLSVYYVFTVKELPDPDGIVHKMLERYSNIKFIYAEVPRLFEGTPLYNLSLDSAWMESNWAGTHLSDFMRQALVWHKGGYYSDTD